MTSAKERDKAGETCMVANFEGGQCSEAYRGGQKSVHLFDQ